jgi:hypothetical protein
MANTYFLIASNTVGAGGAASVSFNSISNAFTDLILKYSSRDNDSTSTANNTLIRFNGSTSGYSFKTLADLAGTAYSYSNTDTAFSYLSHNSAGSNSTSNTFDNTEIYIPNYTSSNYKSISVDNIVENNNTYGYLWLTAGLWSNTAAITSISISSSGGSFVQYSSFYLYGIKNS